MRSIAQAACAATLAVLGGCAAPPAAVMATDDPHLWLEDVTGERPLAWVRERNAASQAVLAARPEFAPLKARMREVLDSAERIPHITRIGDHVYNHWTDAAHPRGVWRRTTLADYRNAQPAWETVIDVDALGRAEGVNWNWAGPSCLPARATQVPDRCMISLSRGGADARVFREFDLRARRFVADGFALPEAKQWLAWIDRDTLYVATDFGPGSLTASGYPRLVKRWQRGQPLAAATTVFEGEAGDVSVSFDVDPTPGFERHWFSRAPDFFRNEVFLLRDGRLMRIEKPQDAILQVSRNVLLLQLRSNYTVAGRTHPAGTLLASDFDAYLRGERRFDVLFEPTATRSLARRAVTFTRTRVLLNLTDNVVSRVEELWQEGGHWQRRMVATPGGGQVKAEPLAQRGLPDDPLGESYLMGYEDFLTPDSLFLARTGTDTRDLLKRRPGFFDAQSMRVEQRFATSRDGTRVPYFVLWPRGATADGANPTLLRGYGGFQVSELPVYQATTGNTWLQRGGVLVVANIRGGGEFGPAWHRAAMKQDKQRSYDDFIAVAEDLIAAKITSPKHLGIYGGSNGGLLVGAVVTQRPELFNAVVCAVPILDMKRYHRLLAGASWMAEYGNPDDPAEWAYMSRYSPYHQVRAGTKYPPVFFVTSTRDDRVHPGHARKMVARMELQGHPVLYFENIEGGHGAAADAEQRAHLQALQFSYLWMRLGR